MGVLRLMFRFARQLKRERIRRAHAVRRDNCRTESANYRAGPQPHATTLRLITQQGRAYVVDGDTLDLEGTRIRLSGIDAPELDHPYGMRAKREMERLCYGQTIRAEFASRDHYARHVATCYLPDGRDLAAELVKMGLAVDWPKFSGGKYRHLEPPDVRRKLWRCDARQKGRMPPPA